MELGETIEAAAVRETFEETGLHVRPGALLGVYTGDAHTHANGDVTQSVVVVLTANPDGGRLTKDGIETVGLGWFPLDDLPSPIFAPHRDMLEEAGALRVIDGQALSSPSNPMSQCRP
jgi:8-oxo-dGTP pyrophosphatase MutT (NUDIX family)